MRVLPAVVLAATSACADRVLVYSTPVEVEVRVAWNDVDDGSLDSDQAVVADAGATYEAFLDGARAAMGVDQPSSLQVVAAEVALRSTSGDVAALEQIYAGDLSVALAATGMGAGVEVATVAVGPGAAQGPLTTASLADAFDAADPLFADLLTSGYRIRLVGDVAPGFEDAREMVQVAVTLVFLARAD
ncbi:MAG: hypothetical protein R2939_14670 [Kofleriaceae bacterium]